MKFCFTVQLSREKKILEGCGELGDVTLVMGRPRSGKSLFLWYLFALLTKNYRIAELVSDKVLDEGGGVALEAGGGVLRCVKSSGSVRCSIDGKAEEAYLFHEGWLFAAKYMQSLPHCSLLDVTMGKLLKEIGKRSGKFRYDIDLSRWAEKTKEGLMLDLAFSSSAVVAVGVLERAFLLDAWLLLDGTLDGLFPEDVLYLAGVAASGGARLVVVTHSPWVLDAFRCAGVAAEHFGLPAGRKTVTSYEFTGGGIAEIGLSAKTYGEVFEELYVNCG